MSRRARARVLLVDDEPALLEGLALQLRRKLDVVTAPSGAAGLAALRKQGPFAVVVSDMRMPAMHGTGFLARARDVAPDTVRIVLTGDTDTAIEAINAAQVFRFLCKPCSPKQLREAVEAGVTEHGRLAGERERAEGTLRGSVQVLTHLLTLASPAAFGRADRLRRLAVELAGRLGVRERDLWAIEIAATLSQLGCVGLPERTAERLDHARDLDPAEREQVDRLPQITADLLAPVPHLEEVQEIVRAHRTPYPAASEGAVLEDEHAECAAPPLGARILKLAWDYDQLETQGVAPEERTRKLQGRASEYDPDVLAVFIEMLCDRDVCGHLAEVRRTELCTGMILADDVRTAQGRLLLARGLELTQAVIQHLGHFPRDSVAEPLRVVLPRARPNAEP